MERKMGRAKEQVEEEGDSRPIQVQAWFLSSPPLFFFLHIFILLTSPSLLVIVTSSFLFPSSFFLFLPLP
jgi:hypothetical protein